MKRRTLLPVMLCTSALTCLPAGLPAFAQPTTGWALNSYGLPGGVDTPSAEMLPDGQIGAALSYSEYGQRTNIVAQVLPRVTAVLRYSRIDNVVDKRGFLKDRSADLRLQLLSEDGGRPAVAVGLQDFMGTGVYSGEYVVATKHVGDRLAVSAGVGWGRLGGATRPFPYGSTGGEFKVENWFSGSAKPFGSVSWQATDRLRLVAEYSNDNYTLEVDDGGMPKPGSHLNLGVNYRMGDAYQLSAYSLGGKVFGAQMAITLNMRQSAYPSGLERAPAPVRPRPAPGADPEAWSGAWVADPTAQPAIQKALGDALAKEGQVLEAMALKADRAEVRIDNRRYMAQAEAIGRTARLMTRALPATVETFVITSTEKGVPTSSVIVRRSDVERLENTDAGQIAAAAKLVDAAPRVPGMVATPGVYPRFSWNLGPYASLNAFNADGGIPVEIGARASASYEPTPGLIISGTIQQRLWDNKEAPTMSPLTAPHRVRSDGAFYSENSGPTVERLTLAWYGKPATNIYTRVSAGLLEEMYGGVSAEVLYKPAEQNWGVGVEVNHVRKRDYDKRFTFQDYEVTTGHVSGYLEFGDGYTAELDVGRYLAQDWGATLSLSREFANGWRLGAYVTKTDLSAKQFGEGSFDKGVSVSIPMAWALGTPSRKTVGGTLHSIVRDGGARLDVEGRLYDTVKASHSGEIYQGWGKFWR